MCKSELITVIPISKFKILWLKDVSLINFESHTFDLSSLFWSTLFDKEFFKHFHETYFFTYKRNIEQEDSFNLYLEDYNFILEQLDRLKKSIDFSQGEKIPWADDIFFSYRIFNTILSYYNDFFQDDKIFVVMQQGLVYEKSYNSIDEYIYNLYDFIQSQFVQIFLKPIILKYFQYNTTHNNVLKIDIFWPEELITAAIISKILKEKNPHLKIIIDLSVWNEQFDFTQWGNMILKSKKIFFDFFDFFIIDRDFGVSVGNVLKYIDWDIDHKLLKNVIYIFNNQIQYEKISDDVLNQDAFTHFLKSNFHRNKLKKVFWKNAYYWRLLPYKCYWNKCNFCAINSQNKFTYTSSYSYDFFIDQWIDFIEKNEIYSITFSDEAIPPKVIVKFAKKIIEKGISINYQFRTRIEKYYTLKNCIILFQSWARFCGMWLESAVDRVNEQIWNKWNCSLSIHEKIKIIHNFDRSGISIHNYAIMWFPWETDSEITITHRFLISNILKSFYYTCTPNIFALMKGPKIFTHRDDFGIEVAQSDIDNPFKLIYDFKYWGKERSLWLLTDAQLNIHNTQFLPWLSKNSWIDFIDFWHYIDRSGIFYILKRFYSYSPYFWYMYVNDKVLNMEKGVILKQYFYRPCYIQCSTSYKKQKLYICNWCTLEDTILPYKFQDFIYNYNTSLSLEKNINMFLMDFWLSDWKYIEVLFKNKILLHIDRNDS